MAGAVMQNQAASYRRDQFSESTITDTNALGAVIHDACSACPPPHPEERQRRVIASRLGRLAHPNSSLGLPEIGGWGGLHVETSCVLA
jgi:hypothetical protein